MTVLKLAYLASWLSLFLTYSQSVLAFESYPRRSLALANVASWDSLITSYDSPGSLQEKIDPKSFSTPKTLVQDSVAKPPKSAKSLCDVLSDLDQPSETQLVTEKVIEKTKFREKFVNSWKNLFKWSVNAAPNPSPQSLASKPVVSIVAIADQTQSKQETITRHNRLQSWFKFGKNPNNSSKLNNKNQKFQIFVNNSLIGLIPDQQKALIMARRLESLLSEPNLDPLELAPTLVEGQPAGRINERILFVLDQTLIPKKISNPDLLAIEWINNLRIALNAPPLDLIEAQQKMYGLVETGTAIEGLASWYGPYFHGRLTANGEIYNQHGLTAAHPSMKLNTYLKVTNLNNDKSIIIRINDRGPYIPPRTLDLSLGAAECLDSVNKGVIPYKAVVMKPLSSTREQ